MMLTDQLHNKTAYSEIENTIAEYFLECKEDLTTISARDIARQLYISPSTVTRFTQKLGYSGFSEFVHALQEEKTYLSTHFQEIDPNVPFVQTDSSYQIAGKISALYHETVEDTLSLIDYLQLEKAVKLLNQAEIIHVISAGSQIELGELFKDKMAKIGKRVEVSRFQDISYAYAYQPLKNEVFILISYSGETESVLKVASMLKENNSSFIAITSFGQNTLSRYTDCVLYVSTREKMRRGLGNYSIYLSTLYLFDVLYSCVFRKDYKKNAEQRYTISKRYQTHRDSDNPILKDDE